MAAKVRPALAISVPVESIDRALVTLAPHTTSSRQSRFEVPVSVPFLLERAAILIPDAVLPSYLCDVRSPGHASRRTGPWVPRGRNGQA
jgi:hypothetical protein